MSQYLSYLVAAHAALISPEKFQIAIFIETT